MTQLFPETTFMNSFQPISTSPEFDQFSSSQFTALYDRANLLNSYYLLTVFLLGLLISPLHDTWALALGMGSLSMILYVLGMHLLRKGLLSRLIMALSATLLGLQLVWQLPGVTAVHWIFVSNGLFILLYFDWRLHVLSTLLVLLHHSLVYLFWQSGLTEFGDMLLVGGDLQKNESLQLGIYFFFLLSTSASYTLLAYRLEIKFYDNLKRNFEYEEQFGLMEKGIVFAQEISKGNLDVAYEVSHEKEILGKALLEMRENLKDAALKESQENYINVGIAQLSKILQNNLDQVQLMADAALANMVNYLGAKLGALMAHKTVGEEEHLELLASYAYNRKKFHQKSIVINRLSEDLSMQVFLEKKEIYIQEIPSDYVHITSALGETSPNHILIFPLITNEEIVGVLELATLCPIEKHQMEYIRRASEGLAAALVNSKNVQTQELLEKTQEQAERLGAIEEELRQNLEEMSTTQEEMKRKEIELQGNLSAINRTLATIEFDLQGNVLTANDIFLNTLKYKMEDIRNQHHRLFVDSVYAQSEEYTTFWKNLSKGMAHTAEFKRIAKDGSEIWLQATYTPVYDSSGRPFKIIKLATDITEQKEQAIYAKGQMKALRRSSPYIVFNPDGIIKDVNVLFLNLMEYEREEVLGQHHEIFVEEDYRNSPAYATFWQKLRDGQFINGEQKRISKTGKEVWIYASYNPILNLDGKVINIIKTAQDISSQKELEFKNAQIIEQLRAKGLNLENQN